MPSANPLKSENSVLVEAQERTIDRFLDAVWMERGLSANTLAAYRADLNALSRWLLEQDLGLLDAGREHLLGFVAARAEAGASHARPHGNFRASDVFSAISFAKERSRRSDGPHRDAQSGSGLTDLRHRRRS